MREYVELELKLIPISTEDILTESSGITKDEDETPLVPFFQNNG